MFPNEFDDLVNLIREIPGISSKQAYKIIIFLLSKKTDVIEKNINKFLEIFKSIKECEICGYYTNKKICEICKSSSRKNTLMIVENADQIRKYEEWKIFNGKYYQVPFLFNKKFERLDYLFDFEKLLNYVENFDEIILGISPTPEGVLTSNLIFNKIKKEKPNAIISKLAIGLPMGSSIDYVDQLTMSLAIKNRKDIKE